MFIEKKIGCLDPRKNSPKYVQRVIGKNLCREPIITFCTMKNPGVVLRGPYAMKIPSPH